MPAVRPGRTATVVAVALATIGLSLCGTARADIVYSNEKDTVTVGRVDQRRPAAVSSSWEADPVYKDCQTKPLSLTPVAHTTNVLATFFLPPLAPVDSVWQSCIRIADNQRVTWMVDPATGVQEVDPLTMMIDMARATIVIPLPAIATSPPLGGTQLVGLPLWFWSQSHFPVSVTATIPGLSATLTATPGPLHIDMGDGTSFTCSGGGTPYDPNRSYRDQSTDCAGTYDRHGPYTATATVVWALSWVATNGQSGTLPSVTRQASVDLNIRQAQAVTD